LFYNAGNATFSPFGLPVPPMPAPTSTAELLDLVRKSGLYDGDSFDDRLSAIPDLPEQPVSMATVLVKHGLITKFQAKLLLLGKYRGFRIGPYAIKEQIGQGGMGAVYLAEHTTLSRKVALKVLTPGADSDTKLAVERFLREARSAAALDHPNIVRLHDVGQFGTTYYIVMELVEGDTLDKLVTKSGSIPCGKAVEYIAQAAAGLQHAYEKGFVHRDIKPQNLILSKDGTVKILDMGLARSSEERDKLTANIDIGAILGTADYIAPEQAVNDPNVDIRADIYSLGATFYTLVTGRPPFGGNTTQKLVQHQVKDAPSLTRLDKTLPKELADVVSRMMAKKKEQRFRTPADVIAALTPWLPNSGKIVAGLTNTEAGAAGQETMENFVASSTKSLTKSLKLAVRDPKKKYLLFGAVAASVMLFGALLGYFIFGNKKAIASNKGPGVTPVASNQSPGVTDPSPKPGVTAPSPRVTTTKTVFRVDFSKLKPFTVRMKENAIVEGEKGLLPQGVAPYAKGPGSESIFSAGPADEGGTSIAMTNLTGTPGTELACEMEKPIASGGAGMTLTPGVDYKLRIECRTDGTARIGVGIHTIVGYKPAAEYTMLSLVKGDWQTLEIPFYRSDAGGLRFVLENRGKGQLNTMFVRSIEVRQMSSNAPTPSVNPTPPPTTPTKADAGTLFQWDPKSHLGMKFSVNGYDVESGTKPDLPKTFALHCWKPGSKGEFRCEPIGGLTAIRFASRNEPCSAQLRIDVEQAEGVALKPNREYEFRVTYQTEGKQSAKLTILSSKFEFLTGVDLPASEGTWRSESITYRREQGPVCLAVNSETPSNEGFISVAMVSVVDLSANKAQ
jgi:serine/threonine protein kinase